MCYAIPGKVKELSGKTVIVDYFGEEKKAINEFYDVGIGDYICAQGGFVIKKVPSDEAKEILNSWNELFFQLQDTDLRLSRVDLSGKNIDKRFTAILDRALENIPLTNGQLLELINTTDTAKSDLLFKTANFLRQKFHKNSCCVHGIIEISNNCTKGCTYCGISTHNKGITRYRMSEEEIVSCAVSAVKDYGFQALVLQSGENPGYTVDELAQIIKRIRKKVAVLICVSFGEVGLTGLDKLYEAGARGLLLRFETSNPKIYAELHPGCSLESRINHIKHAYQLGYVVMTGALIGLPNQSPQDIINDIKLTKELGAEMYSFGPFMPHPNTPLAKNSPPRANDILKTLALARIIDAENAKILVTTAFETLSAEARKQGLMCGANSVMLNVTPVKYRKNYSIYPNKAYSATLIDKQIEETISLLQSLGRAPTDLGITKVK